MIRKGEFGTRKKINIGIFAIFLLNLPDYISFTERDGE